MVSWLDGPALGRKGVIRGGASQREKLWVVDGLALPLIRVGGLIGGWASWGEGPKMVGMPALLPIRHPPQSFGAPPIGGGAGPPASLGPFPLALLDWLPWV